MMNKMMKNNTLVMLLTVLSIFTVTNASAQADSSFSYQGELVDNNSPANGSYDFQVQMLDGLGQDVGTFSEHIGVAVSDGLFNLNVNLGGIDYFDGYENYFLELSVRKNSVGATYTVLSPLQTLQAVPLATNLVNGAATTGQVLTFNGFQWAPSSLPSVNHPWSVSGLNTYYDTIGGKVGIGTAAPNADLNIKGTDDGDLFRIEQNNLLSYGRTAFYVDDNGGASVGTWSTPPPKGLKVNGDVKQSLLSNGLMKYMVYARCNKTGSSYIIRSYNGINSSPITVGSGTVGDVQCVIDFPTNINTRFWQVSAVVNANNRGAHCILNSFDKLDCYRYVTSTGTSTGGDIMVLVY